jgi:hypothetical protein
LEGGSWSDVESSSANESSPAGAGAGANQELVIGLVSESDDESSDEDEEGAEPIDFDQYDAHTTAVAAEVLEYVI